MLKRQIFFSVDSPRAEKKVKSIDTCIICYMYIYYLSVCLFVFNNYMSKRVHRSGLNFLRQLTLPQDSGKVMDGKNCKMLKTVNNCSMLTVNALGFNLNALTYKWFSVALYMYI